MSNKNKKNPIKECLKILEDGGTPTYSLRLRILEMATKDHYKETKEMQEKIDRLEAYIENLWKIVQDEENE